MMSLVDDDWFFQSKEIKDAFCMSDLSGWIRVGMHGHENCAPFQSTQRVARALCNAFEFQSTPLPASRDIPSPWDLPSTIGSS